MNEVEYTVAHKRCGDKPQVSPEPEDRSDQEACCDDAFTYKCPLGIPDKRKKNVKTGSDDEYDRSKRTVAIKTDHRSKKPGDNQGQQNTDTVFQFQILPVTSGLVQTVVNTESRPETAGREAC